MLSLKEGKELVELARKSVSYYLYTGKVFEKETNNENFLEKKGCFVSIHSFPEKQLLGCIGFPYTEKALWNAIIEAAIQAAFFDPRFPKLREEELNKTEFEISILTKPEEIEKGKELQEIEIGRDGLIVKMYSFSGLLLPQVAKEFNWKKEEFLEHACLKAALQKNAWKEKDCKVLKFQAQIFKETKPNQEVIEVIQ